MLKEAAPSGGRVGLVWTASEHPFVFATTGAPELDAPDGFSEYAFFPILQAGDLSAGL
jgi:hypothetical protein